MRTSTILLTVAAILLIGAAAAIGFMAGRAGVADDQAPAIYELSKAPTTGSREHSFSTGDQAAPSDPRADLIRALGQPERERNGAVRLAMNAWLAADGAAAIMAARDDPELGDVAERMIQLALYVYPEIVVDNPELLDGMSEQSIAMAVSGIATFNPAAARAMIDTHFSNSMYGDAMLSMVDQVERQDSAAQQDPRAELEAILAERGMMRRLPRLHQLVTRVAADDPLAAAELVDDMPGSLKRQAIHPLVEVWSRTDPEEAARWLMTQGSQTSQEGLSILAWRWGQSDLEAANAFANTLTGGKRSVFLSGLTGAVTQRLSQDEMLAWASRYENDPAYPNLVMGVAQRLVQDDANAAIGLIETLPAEERASSYRSVVSSLAYQDPEAALDLVDEIGNAAVRDEVLPMISSAWGNNDAESALDWALDLERGGARDRALVSIAYPLMEFDMDRAVDAIDEIDDPEVRRIPARAILMRAESDAEAIRLGRDFGLDRDAVIELREQRGNMHGPGLIAPFSSSVSVVRPAPEKDPDTE